MSEGMLMFVRLRRSRGRAARNGRASGLRPTTRCGCSTTTTTKSSLGEVGELCCRGPYTLRGYYGVPEYNARQFTADGFYRSGDLMRQHPSGQLHGRRAQEGPDQPRRRENQRRGGREPDPLASGGEERRLHCRARSRLWASACAPASSCATARRLTLRRAEDFPARQGNRQIQAARAAGNPDRFSALHIRQGVEEASGRNDFARRSSAPG